MRLLSRSFCVQTKNAVVLNCGSSSVKYQLFQNETSILRGSIENIGSSSCVHLRFPESSTPRNSSTGKGIVDYASAITAAIDSVLSITSNIFCVGHRVVHGGPHLTGPTHITDTVLEEIRNCTKLAPLHNPSNVRGIELAKEALNSVPQIACFDTAFHSHIPRKAYLYGIPISISKNESIRRYGFHGLSYSYISNFVKEKRIVVVHLGSGCSAAAIVNGVSIDTTMGFTPMEGLIMSTRSGSVDPGVILYLASKLGGDIEKLSRLLNKESGLLGLSACSADMKELLRLESEEGDSRANLAHDAIEVFIHSVQTHIGQLLASLEFDVHSIVFTGGIGENSSEIRERVIRPFINIGATIDFTLNRNVPTDGVISTRESKVKIMAIKTNEEKQIAMESIHIASAL